jgi:hypothetical protein
MHKKTWAKLGGFVVAAACTATLVGFAATNTGAYFTDSAPGSINASTGNVTVNTAGTTLNFTGLLPGQYQPLTFIYNVNSGSAAEDVYLEFSHVDAFQHIPQDGAVPLGRYGHLAVSGPAGSFSSFNLAQDPDDATGNTDGRADDCQVDQYGRGGYQTAEATDVGDHTVGYCPAPKFILLSANLDPSDGNQTASITFGYTGLLQSPQNRTNLLNVPFKVVAVQHGILPGNSNNGL